MRAVQAMIVLGHGFADAEPLPFPAPLLLLGGTDVVLAATAITSQHSRPVPALARTLGPGATLVLRVLAVALLLAIVLPAVLAPADLALNAAPRLLFTVAWAGLLLVSGLLGPLWVRANPLRWAAGPTNTDLFARVGVRPAVAALIGFTIAEQLFEPTPLVVLCVVGLYVVGTFGGAIAYGTAWFRAVDPVETASRLVGRLAPIGRQGRAVVARRVRAGVAGTGAVPGMAAFLGVLIGASLYDALEASGSVGTRALLLGGTLLAAGGFATVAARPVILAPALIPAAAAHLGTHYLAPLLVDTQIAVIQLSDPFAKGWNLLGLTGTEVIAEPIPPIAGQVLQLVILLAGHGLAMAVANDIGARRMEPSKVAAALFPLRAAILASLLAGIYLWLVV